MKSQIHKTAIVSSKAKIGKNVKIEAYAIIKDDVEIGNNCNIGPHTVIYDGARIGNNVVIHQASSIANAPQDLKYAGEKTFLYIGDNTTIREYATLNRGTDATGFSKVGSNCLLMAYTHIGHDCVVGDNCILANAVTLGGHVEIGDFVIIGGLTPVHQFSKVGQHAMIGGGFRIIKDIPPYIVAGSEPLRFSGLNLIGLRRRGFTNDDIAVLKDAYKIIYSPELNFSQAIEKLKDIYSEHQLVKNIVNFISNSSRGIIRK